MLVEGGLGNRLQLFESRKYPRRSALGGETCSMALNLKNARVHSEAAKPQLASRARGHFNQGTRRSTYDVDLTGVDAEKA